MKKVLLLTNRYEFNSFISEFKAIKLLVKGKAEALSYWDENIKSVNKEFKLPSILRLCNNIKNIFHRPSSTFNRNAIIRRDKSMCQYCQKPLSIKEISIDHVIPRSLGGKNSYTNCVVSCHGCNSLKRNRTPEQAGMKLISDPKYPKTHILYVGDNGWHKDWSFYIKN